MMRNPQFPGRASMRDLATDQRRIKRALNTYVGSPLDADHETLADGWYHTFEQETLLTLPRLAPGILQHLFHRLEQRLTGLPTLIEMDEATLPMVLPDYEKALPAWAMTKRKQNVSLIISLPLVSLLNAEALRPLLEQSCPQKILTPNPEAMAADVSRVYRGMGCSETMIEQLATRRPRYEYLLMSPYGTRWFQSDLGGVLSVFCGSTNAPEDQALIDRVLAEHPAQDFGVAYLIEKGYLEEAKQLARMMEGSR